MPLAGDVNFPLTHMKGINTDLSPGTSLEGGTTRIFSAWWFSNCILGCTSRCQCLSAVVTDKIIAANGEVTCICCLGPRAKVCLKLSILGNSHYCGLALLQAPSAKWQFSPQNCTLYPACPCLCRLLLYYSKIHWIFWTLLVHLFPAPWPIFSSFHFLSIVFISLQPSY